MNDQLHVSADSHVSPERELPCSLEAEQAVIGGLILDNSAWSRVSDLVRENDFYRAEHRLIFKAISKMADNGRAFDVVTLHDLLSTDGDLEGAGGHAYLAELFQNTPSVANISTYARVVSERASLRHIVGISDTIRKSALQPNGKEADELVHEAEQLILSVASSRPKAGGPIELNQLLSQAVRKIERLQETGGEAGGLSTSFHDLDKKLNYLRPADLIIVAGRPSMGKTTFAMNVVEHAVLHSDKVVLVYSLEMPGEALITRMLSSIGSIDHTRVRSGQLLDDDWSKLTRAANLLNKGGEGRFFIDDTAGISPSDMRFRTRRVQRAHGKIGLIMVDYLQLMQIPGSAGKNRTNEISEISRSLKALAKEFDCPVVALSQLNRSVEQRANKRPVNSDLRESGAIEQTRTLSCSLTVTRFTTRNRGFRALLRSSSANSVKVLLALCDLASPAASLALRIWCRAVTISQMKKWGLRELIPTPVWAGLALTSSLRPSKRRKKVHDDFPVSIVSAVLLDAFALSPNAPTPAHLLLPEQQDGSSL